MAQHKRKKIKDFLKDLSENVMVYARLRKVGHVMRDGTIYAGISPDTRRPMFAAPVDENTLLDFNQAAKRAKERSKETGRKYRVPSKAELSVLFNNRAKIGGFSPKYPSEFHKGWQSISVDPRRNYWSSSCVNNNADFQSFDSGRNHRYLTDSTHKMELMSVRLVRG